MRIPAAILGLAMAATAACALAESGESGPNPTISTKVFTVPAGSRPHDVAPGPEGQIWYTGQRRGTLGIIDIESGAVREIALGEGSAPHGVIQGADGKAYITDGGQNAIVRFDPATETLEVWKLPEGSGYTNLNTGAFDGEGVHWFTGQSGVYGKVDPADGIVTVWPDPDGRGPYGITGTPDGEIYYVSLAGSHLGQIDRASGKVTMIEPPDEGAGLRRVWADSKGDLWVSGWNSGKLYRYHRDSGAWDQWPLPGEKAQNYAIYVDERDWVWMSDFASNNTYVFFPDSESFVAIPGSGPNAGVRQILGRGNEVYLPESGLDRVMLVTIGE
jgi:virginiamycin B lyase